MILNRRFNKKAKLVSSIMNVLLVLGVLVVLFPLSTPTAKADTLWYDNWDIWNGEDITLDDDTIILNGTLWIHEGGKLTLDNCILQMRYKSGYGHLIDVDGTFNLLNNSLITTNSTSPDPYEFRIDGTALINNSIVEKMDDLSGESDGIQIYSEHVHIINSTIQYGEGNGVYIEGETISIINSNIKYNNNIGLYLNSSSNSSIIENNVISNSYTGIYLKSSSDNIITDNNASNNGIMRNGYGIYLDSSSDNDIIGNIASNNGYITLGRGILLRYSEGNNISNNIVNSNHGYGIACEQSSSNNSIHNNIVYNHHDGGILLWQSSNNNIVTNNTAYNSPNHGIAISLSNNNIISNNTAV